ncbi:MULTISPECIES: type II toxin-antitoxin system HicB family antitoxin [unclassified Anabaena]|uniref:type II toxin-antitoxin system HicB family antitoxin n=1 Tax=unclassified Anabaena TaxID=2619674 RepID=UPI0039C66240
MKREFNVIIERDADCYFVASVPNLPGCHTQAQTLDELIERIREAIELCLEFEEDQLEPLDFVGIQRVAVDTSVKSIVKNLGNCCESSLIA